MTRGLKLFGFVVVALLTLVADELTTGKPILIALLVISKELLEKWGAPEHAPAPRAEGSLPRLGHVLSSAVGYALVALAVAAALAALAWTILPLTGALR